MNKVLNYMAIPGIPKSTNRDRSKLFRVFDPEVTIKTICEHFDMSLVGLQIKCKKREVVIPRQVIMYFLTEYTDMTYKQISAIFNQDHTTAIHSKNTIRDLISTDEAMKARIDELKKQIANNH